MTDATSPPVPIGTRLFPPGAKLLPELVTLAIAAAGGLGFTLAGIPGGALSGAMLAVAVAAALRIAAPVSLATRIAAMAVSGLSVGSAASPETVRNIVTYPASILVMALAVYATTAASALMSVWLSRWSRTTAVLAGVPGAMSYVLSLAMTPGLKADVPQIVVVQMGRLLFLVAGVPLLIAESGTHLAPLGFTRTDPWWMVAAMLPATAVGGWLFHRFKVAGGVMFGSLLVSATLHATGIAPGRVPPAIMIAGQILIGAWAGSRFVGFDWVLLFRSLKGALAAIGAAMLVALAFAAFGAAVLHLPFAAALLAYAPGGLEAMTMLAFGLSIDPLFVAAHHFARVLVINFSMPFVMRHWVEKPEK